MGTDKAFLEYRGRPFIALITEEMLKVSDEVLVMIGRKEEPKFRTVLDKKVEVANDSLHLTNPIGGMLSSFPLLNNDYAAFLACDTPFVRAEVITFLHQSALGHDAAIPVWEDSRIEPLCAVYNVQRAHEAGLRALAENRPSCNHLIHFLKDVRYVEVDALRRFDPGLASLRNVNSREEFRALR